MATALSAKNVTVSLWIGAEPSEQNDQVTVEGLSNSDTAVLIAPIDTYSGITPSLSGSLHGRPFSKQGGDVTIEITGYSPTLPWVLRRAEALRNLQDDTEVRIHGVIEYGRVGQVMNLSGGLLTSFRPGSNFGNPGLSVCPFTIRFEEIVGDLTAFNPDLSEREQG